MKLKFLYTKLLHPYSDEKLSEGEVWAEMKLYLTDESTGLVKIIFDIQWNIIVFIDWIIENKNSLLNEDILPKLPKALSIANGIFDYYKNLEDVEEHDESLNKELDSIYEYKTRHCLSFSLRGIDIIPVYIGNINGQGTISYFDSKDQWNYNIDIKQFVSEIEKINTSIR